MIQTITPVVHGGRRSWWRSVILHVIGASIAAAALGAALGAVGRALGAPWGPPGFIAATAIAAAYVLREAFGVPVPIPELRRQVPEWWRASFRPGVTSLLYGLGLGVGFATHLRHGTLVAVGAAVVTTGDPLLGAIVLAPFGLARGVTVVAAAEVTTQEALVSVMERLERWARGALPRASNTAALVGIAAALSLAAMRAGGSGTSGIAPLVLAAVLAWAAAAKIATFRTWRRALGSYALGRRATTIAAIAVPALEAVAAVTLILAPRLGGAVAAALLASFSIALVRARARAGDRLPCGCFGGDRKRDVRGMLWRNTGLAALATITTAAPVAGAPAMTFPTAADAIPATLSAVGVVLALVTFRTAWRLSARTGADR